MPPVQLPPFLLTYTNEHRVDTIQLSTGIWVTSINHQDPLYASRTRLGALLTHAYHVARIHLSKKGGTA
jgi:hypothetical protein